MRIALAFILTTVSVLFGALGAWGADITPWTELQFKIIANGEISSTILGETRSLSHAYEKGSARIQEYISLLGNKNERGEFIVKRASLVSEISRSESDHFIVEQVLRYMDSEGDLVAVQRRVLVFSADKKSLISSKDQPLGSAEDEVSQFQALMNMWQKSL